MPQEEEVLECRFCPAWFEGSDRRADYAAHIRMDHASQGRAEADRLDPPAAPPASAPPAPEPPRLEPQPLPAPEPKEVEPMSERPCSVSGCTRTIPAGRTSHSGRHGIARVKASKSKASTIRPVKAKSKRRKARDPRRPDLSTKGVKENGVLATADALAKAVHSYITGDITSDSVGVWRMGAAWADYDEARKA